MDLSTTCRYCHVNISSSDFFCPNCGKKLKEKPQSTTLVRQIFIYLISALLPPLGLWPAIRYLRQPDTKSKKIGWIAIILTVISVIATIWFSYWFINDFDQMLGGQLNPYEGMGLGF